MGCTVAAIFDDGAAEEVRARAAAGINPSRKVLRELNVAVMPVAAECAC